MTREQQNVKEARKTFQSRLKVSREEGVETLPS